jgi:hypothetical protein
MWTALFAFLIERASPLYLKRTGANKVCRNPSASRRAVLNGVAIFSTRKILNAEQLGGALFGQRNIVAQDIFCAESTRFAPSLISKNQKKECACLEISESRP